MTNGARVHFQTKTSAAKSTSLAGRSLQPAADDEGFISDSELQADVSGLVFVSDEQENAEDSDWMRSVRDSSAWLGERPESYYPKDPRLPWHTCWIDDHWIGGSSAPVERQHYPALLEAGVGLIVNLTECAVIPSPEGTVEGSMQCSSCKHVADVLSPDLFDDIQPTDTLEVLHLPMPDGSVPSEEQLRLFLTHAQRFIQSGKRVLVHCQAGVGRTGCMLAVYLMEKYSCTAKKALEQLRWIRPQSLRWHPKEWALEPFRLHHHNSYDRNLLQERFLWRYWRRHIEGREGTRNPEDVHPNRMYYERSQPISCTAAFPIPIESFAHVYLPVSERPITPIDHWPISSSLTESRTPTPSPTPPFVDSSSSALSVLDGMEGSSSRTARSDPIDFDGALLKTLLDAELDSRMAAFEARSVYREIQEAEAEAEDTSAYLCFPCRGITSVGPARIGPRSIAGDSIEVDLGDLLYTKSQLDLSL